VFPGDSGGLLEARDAVVREGVENSVSDAKREQSVSGSGSEKGSPWIGLLGL
jgi:hypothetical protein